MMMMIMYIEACLSRVEKTWARSEKKYIHVPVELLLIYIDCIQNQIVGVQQGEHICWYM